MKEGKLFIQLGKHILGLYSVTCKQLHLIQPMYPAVFLVLPRGQFGSWSFPKYLDGDLLMHYAPNKIFFFLRQQPRQAQLGEDSKLLFHKPMVVEEYFRGLGE